MSVKEFGTGRTRLEIASELGIKPGRVVNKVSIADRIEAGRRLIAVSQFDEKRCERGLDALTSYTKEFDEKRGTYIEHPLHDWSSHGAEGYQTLAVGVRDTLGKTTQAFSDSAFDPMHDQTADADFDPRVDAVVA